MPKRTDEHSKRNTEVEQLIATSGRSRDEVAKYMTRRLGRDFQDYLLSRVITGKRRIQADELDALRELAAQPATETPVAPQLTETSDVVPLFGYANAAGVVLRINEEQRVGVVPIHPAQKGSRSAFAFICFGDSVSPRLNHGEIGYAIRNRPPFRHQLCVVERFDGEALVKFYEGVDANTLFLSELIPKPAKISIPLREVSGIHAVVGASFGSA